MDYASPETRNVGERLIEETLAKSFKTKRKQLAATRLRQIEDGKRDVYV
jgi:2-iminoacetate synthase